MFSRYIETIMVKTVDLKMDRGVVRMLNMKDIKSVKKKLMEQSDTYTDTHTQKLNFKDNL